MQKKPYELYDYKSQSPNNRHILLHKGMMKTTNSKKKNIHYIVIKFWGRNIIEIQF